MEECRIHFPGPVSRKTVSLLAIDYMKYILYYRGQFPLPLDQLKSIKNLGKDRANFSSRPTAGGHMIYCDTPDRSTLSTAISTRSITNQRSEQKFFEAISKFDNFFSELAEILETKNVMEIVLNLGPNLMKPKELYHIALPTVYCNEECATDYASLQNCKVQFYRKIISDDTIWADLKSDALLPISVLLLLENGDGLDQQMELKRFYALPKNCKQRTVRFIDNCSHFNSSSIELENTTVTHSSSLWVKLKPDLKGFKSYNES